MTTSASGGHSSHNVLAAIDARTNLAGTNKMELLLFTLGTEQIYGINVFKVKEIIRKVEITQSPFPPEHVLGMASLRDELVPVIDLISFCGNQQPNKPPVMIVTEFSHTTQAFLAATVETIIRVDWGDIQQPPHMLEGRSKLTGVTKLADGRLVSILDVEQLLYSLSGKTGLDELPDSVRPDPKVSSDVKVFFADDSAFARAQLQQVLDKIGVSSEFAVNGRAAWERLDEIAAGVIGTNARVADILPVIITDIEMPEMDGFKLTRTIKGDRRFDGVKVLLHSSMSESSNRDKGLAMGADGFLAKYNPAEVAKSLQAVLSEGA